MPTTGGAVKKRKTKSAARKKPAARKGKKSTVTKRKTTSKYSEKTSDQLRKMISRYNKGKPKEKRIKTTVKVRKGAKVVTRPKKKSALVAACKKHRL